MKRLCECGCGLPTLPAKTTHTASGRVKGKPQRFILGHHGPAIPRDENHPQFKGEDVGYSGLHKWLSRRKVKTGVCSGCGQTRKTEWANVSGVYLRDLADYVELCRLCHEELDRDLT
jgi:hypothetical protein